jgi:hypothetical protein
MKFTEDPYSLTPYTFIHTFQGGQDNGDHSPLQSMAAPRQVFHQYVKESVGQGDHVAATPPGITLTEEYEGVDGKSGLPGAGRTGPIDVTDSKKSAHGHIFGVR